MASDHAFRPRGHSLSKWVGVPIGSPSPYPFPNTTETRGHMFYIGLYRANMEKSSCLKPQGLKS